MQQHTMTRAAALAAAVAFSIGLAGCGDGGDQRLEPAAGAGAPTPTAGPVTPDGPGGPNGPDAPGGPEGGGQDPPRDGTDGGGSGSGDAGSGGSGSGGSGSGDAGSGGGSGNEPPYIEDLFQDAYLYGDANERVIAADLAGHAYDPDSQHEQGSALRVSVDWGDGTTSDASLEGHGAFRDYHDYDLSYAGQTMTVRIVAHGYDGQTATETVSLSLPAS